MELLLRYSQLSKSCCERENHWWWQWWLPFPSNINIPAWSLFSPRGKSLFHFESSLWMLEMFPWYFPLLVYLLVSRWCANLSHQAQTALFPQSKGQNNCHGRDGRVCVCVCGAGGLIDHTQYFLFDKLPEETDIVHNTFSQTCLWGLEILPDIFWSVIFVWKYIFVGINHKLQLHRK